MADQEFVLNSIIFPIDTKHLDFGVFGNQNDIFLLIKLNPLDFDIIFV